MRNIIYKYSGITVSKNDACNRLYIDNKETDLYTMMGGLLSQSRGNKNGEIFVAFCGLKYQAVSIVNYLYMRNFTMLGNANKKDLRVGNYRLRYTGENCYYIQIKTGAHSYLTLQGVEAVIGLKQMPENKADLEKALDLYKYTRAQFLSGLKKSETRILYSSASISRTMFNRCNKDYCISAGYLKKSYMYGEKRNKYLEEYCRPCIHGGYNYVSEYGYKYHGSGVILDVNSLYDAVASNCYLPYPYVIKYGQGTPDIKYIKRKYMYYTIMKVVVTATLKEDGLPCVMQDGTSYGRQDYLTEMHKRPLTMTEADRKMLYENYNITYFSIKSYVVFKADKKTFADYIKPLYEKKRTLKKGMERDFVKSLLVGFIGTFARKVYKDEYIFIEKDGRMIAQKQPRDERQIEKDLNGTDGLCFVNAAIVSASRYFIVAYIRKYNLNFLYTDTDSIHLAGQIIPDGIPISDKMGDFKIEHTFTSCEYRDIKKYMIVEKGVIIPTVAGIPKNTFADYDKSTKIYSYIKHQDIHKLFVNPFEISQLVEDIDTGTVSYESHMVRLDGVDIRSKVSKKLEEARKRRAGYDYYNGVKLTDSLKDNYGREAILHHQIERWNYSVRAGIIKKPTFEEAVAFLRDFKSPIEKKYESS